MTQIKQQVVTPQVEEEEVEEIDPLDMITESENQAKPKPRLGERNPRPSHHDLTVTDILRSDLDDYGLSLYKEQNGKYRQQSKRSLKYE